MSACAVVREGRGNRFSRQEIVAKAGDAELQLHVGAGWRLPPVLETARRGAGRDEYSRGAAVPRDFGGRSPLEGGRSRKSGAPCEAARGKCRGDHTRAWFGREHWQQTVRRKFWPFRMPGPAAPEGDLGTVMLLTVRHVDTGVWLAMMAGAEFIKNSTGKEAVCCKRRVLPVAW